MFNRLIFSSIHSPSRSAMPGIFLISYVCKTFEAETSTFAILVAADLNNVLDPIKTVKDMVNFVNFILNMIIIMVKHQHMILLI